MVLSSYFYLGYFPYKLEQPLQDIELQEKEEKTDSSCRRKETVDVEILITYIEVEPIQSVQIKICQSNA